MALIRWEPVPTTRLLHSLFDSATVPTAPARRFAPATDLIESDSHYIVRADLPGVAPEDVSVELTDNVLTVSGERASRSETTEGGYRRIERSAGSFRRSVRVPAGVDPEAITASFEHGVLEVSVPKPEGPKAHTIAITTGDIAGDTGDTAAAIETGSDEPAAA